MVGWRSMKALTAPDTHIITPMASTMAATMMGSWSGLARPTAVNTESSENTMSMSAICTTMSGEVREHARVPFVARALERVVDLGDALGQQEQAA